MESAKPRQRILDAAAAWLRRNRALVLWSLLLVLLMFMRDLWAPDEPDFAQCVKEMRARGAWLLPYLNGEPYNEKPILFYWLMKGCAMAGDWLTGGRGFSQGIAAWALRLPSVAAGVLFMGYLQAWARRFLDPRRAEAALLVLATAPLWFWQCQFIQIDLLFCALLAWSWLSWLGGWLVLRGHAPELRPGEAGRRFLVAWLALALAFLAKGPLALVLTGALLLAFLAWQRDWRALGAMRAGWGLLVLLALVAPWYVAAGLKGGATYFFHMLWHQNVERALKAWDHIQPWYQYVPYLIQGFFPWVLLLPALFLELLRSRSRDPRTRFLLLAFLVPLLLLSASQSKQAKYLLMAYPFLALLLGGFLLDREDQGERRSLGRLGAALAAGLALPGLAMGALALGAGGAKLRLELAPFRDLLGAGGLILLAGAAALLLLNRERKLQGRALALLRRGAGSLFLLCALVGTLGFHRLDPVKGYRAWTAQAAPLLQGHRVFFWQTIRSGVMVYTDTLMPELRSWEELEARMGPEDLLVSMRREWDEDLRGMNPGRRAQFQVLLRVRVGSGEAMLLKRAVSPGRKDG